MAKQKTPKKTNGGQAVVSSPNIPTPATTQAPIVNQTTAAAPSADTPTPRKTEPKKTRKPEIVKSDPRSNLVPINMDHEIRQLAYLLSERRGFEPGHETEDWLAAEHEVLERYHQQHSA